MEIKLAFTEFLNYLRYPTFNYKRDLPLGIGLVTMLYFIVFTLEMLLLIPASALSGMEDIPHAMEGFMEDKPFWQVFSLVVITAPAMEEVMFRLHLRYKPLLFLFGWVLGMALLATVYGWWPDVDNAGSMEGGLALLDQWASLLLGLVAVTVLVLGVYFMMANVRQVADAWVVKLFPVLFYLTAAVFALIHVFNFELPADQWYLTPLLVMPQFVLALYLGYIRVRNGLVYSIYIHALNNCIPLLIYKIGTQYMPS